MMDIHKAKRKYIGLVSLYTILCAGLGVYVLNEALPGHYFGGYPLIPVYFYLFGLFSIYVYDACQRRMPQKMLLVFLAMKVLKILVSILLMLIYCVIFREEARNFMLTFIAFYLAFLIYETWFFFKFEVNLKRFLNNKNSKKDETVA